MAIQSLKQCHLVPEFNDFMGNAIKEKKAKVGVGEMGGRQVLLPKGDEQTSIKAVNDIVYQFQTCVKHTLGKRKPEELTMEERKQISQGIVYIRSIEKAAEKLLKDKKKINNFQRAMTKLHQALGNFLAKFKFGKDFNKENVMKAFEGEYLLKPSGLPKEAWEARKGAKGVPPMERKEVEEDWDTIDLRETHPELKMGEFEVTEEKFHPKLKMGDYEVTEEVTHLKEKAEPLLSLEGEEEETTEFLNPPEKKPKKTEES